jgi:sugar phosphate isomerase/epimerase
VPIVSLDHLTLFELAPPGLVDVAAAVGFDHVGLRLHPAAPPHERQHPMLGDSPMRRETLARLRDTGVSVFDFGVFRLRRDMDLGAFERVLETATALGARRAVVNGDERDPMALAELLHRLCVLGAKYGVRMNLEPTPWSGIPTLGTALAVLHACNRPDARLLVDALHFDRSSSTLAELAALPSRLVDYVQVCDAAGPRPGDFETMIHQARHERALPGDGNLDLAGLLTRLPPGIPMSIEAPVNSLAARLSPLQRARRAKQSMGRLIAATAGACKPRPS